LRCPAELLGDVAATAKPRLAAARTRHKGWAHGSLSFHQLAENLPVVSAAGVGTAFASTSAPSTPATVQAPTAAVDTPTAGDTVDAPGAADVQQGNQSTPDTAGAGAEKAGTESPEAPGSEKGSVSDGPGGFADQGGSNTNTQQQGNN